MLALTIRTDAEVFLDALGSTSLPYRIVLGRADLLPLCDVFLLGPKGRQHVVTIIDSEADFPVFHLRAAQDAGLNLSRTPNFSVQYGGSVSAGWRIRAYLELARHRFDTEIIFTDRLDFP